VVLPQVVTVQQLQPFLEDDEPLVASTAMSCLGRVDNPAPALPLLLPRLAGPAAAEAAAALRVILRLKPADVIAAFESLLMPGAEAALSAAAPPTAAGGHDVGMGQGGSETVGPSADADTGAEPREGEGGLAMKIVAQKDAIRMLEEAELPEVGRLLLLLLLLW
jgi:HEAT repeat protein